MLKDLPKDGYPQIEDAIDAIVDLRPLFQTRVIKRYKSDSVTTMPVENDKSKLPRLGR